MINIFQIPEEIRKLWNHQFVGDQCLWISRATLTLKITSPPTWYKYRKYLEKCMDKTSYTWITSPFQSNIYSITKIFVIHKHWPLWFIMILLQATTQYRHHFSTSSVALGWLLPRETVLGLSKFCLYSAVVLLLCKKKDCYIVQQIKHHYWSFTTAVNQVSYTWVYYMYLEILVKNISLHIALADWYIIHGCYKKWKHLLCLFELTRCRIIA